VNTKKTRFGYPKRACVTKTHQLITIARLIVRRAPSDLRVFPRIGLMTRIAPADFFMPLVKGPVCSIVRSHDYAALCSRGICCPSAIRLLKPEVNTRAGIEVNLFVGIIIVIITFYSHRRRRTPVVRSFFITACQCRQRGGAGRVATNTSLYSFRPS